MRRPPRDRGSRDCRWARAGDGFTLETSGGTLDARRVVLATGGLSLPKTGSDGRRFAIARRWAIRLSGRRPPLHRSCSMARREPT